MDKFSKIKNSLAQIISFSEEELLFFCNVLEVRKLKKNEFFLEEGKVCDYIGFINNGVVVYFKTTESGSEVTTDFAFDGDWVTNNQSRLNNSPSLINIKAIEKTELLVIKQQTLSDLYIKIPKTERLGRILIEQAFLRIVQQSIELQVFSAKERYENLLKKFPEAFHRIPLYHLANYLGIAPKSLSRIRKELFY